MGEADGDGQAGEFQLVVREGVRVEEGDGEGADAFVVEGLETLSCAFDVWGW